MLYFIGLAAGFLLANQSAINAKLGAAVRSPFRSSLISFSVGTIFLIAVFLALFYRITRGGFGWAEFWVSSF